MGAQPYVLITPNGSSQADEWCKLGLGAQVAGKMPEAESHYKQALRLDPQHAVASQNLAVMFAQVGNLNEAILTCQRAVLFDDKLALLRANLAFMLLDCDRLEEALATAREAVQCSKEHGLSEDLHGYLSSRLALAMISATAGRPQDSLPAYAEMLAKEPKHPVANPNSCFVQTLVKHTPADLRANRDRWYNANRYEGVKAPHPNDKNPDRPLKVGYVGGDFKRHSAAMIFGSVVLKHDKTQIKPYLYCSLPVNPFEDIVTKQFQDCGEWRDISALNDEQAEALIRKDGIDILVDLAGHTNGNGLFFR